MAAAQGDLMVISKTGRNDRSNNKFKSPANFPSGQRGAERKGLGSQRSQKSHRTNGNKSNRKKRIPQYQQLNPDGLSPKSMLGTDAKENNLISNFDAIEEARFEISDFKQNLFGLLDYFNELTAQIQEQNLQDRIHFNNTEYNNKVL